MTAINAIRLIVSALLMVTGLFSLTVTTIGINRFHYVINRMHAAAKTDTMGILLPIASLMVLTGISFTTVKLFLVVLFMWISGPVCTHVLIHLEVASNDEYDKEYKVIDHDSADDS